MEELTGTLFERGIEVADRRNLDYVFKELNFQMSGNVSDDTAKSVGKFLAADMVITGQFLDLDGMYRYRTSAINVETALLASVTRLDVRSDNATKRMLNALAKQQTTVKVAKYGAGADVTPQTAGTFLDRGIMFASKGDYETAIKDFDEASRINPNMAAAYALRARALRASVSDVKQVGDDFSFIGISAPMSKATAEEAQVYKRVVEDLTQAIKLDMSTGQIYTERGYAYSRMGNLNSAMADFDQGIRLDPTPWAFNVRGVDYMHRGDYDRAIADFNSAVRISPDYDSGWFNLSTALKGRSISHFENGNIDSAIADFEQSLGILTNENDKQFLAFMLNRRALEYAYNGDLDRAVTDLEAAFQHDPNNADIRRGLEVIRQQRGR